MQATKSQKRFRIVQKSSLSPSHLQRQSPEKQGNHRLQLQSRKPSELLRFIISPKNLSNQTTIDTSMLKIHENKLISLPSQNSQFINPPDQEENNDNLIIILHQGSQQTKYSYSRKITTTQLRNSLMAKAKGPSRIVSFVTLDKNHLIDYYLTLDDQPMSSLNNPIIELQPMLVDQPEIIGKVSLSQFIIIRCIGSGGFSKVYLVKWKNNGRFYAMKLVDKDFILKNRKQELLSNERDIMSIINHPFTIKMLFAFEQRNFIVFILEFCSGGELFYQLKQVKRMNEEQALFYFTEICLSMLYLHQIGIMYRDIKPENILIDPDGHIKIADFGLSKLTGPDEYAYSFCGSPEYMAPEMLGKKGHSLQVDHYCLGALLYELVTGLPPFYSKNTQKIYDSILNEQISFPHYLSPDIKDLMIGLLTKDPKYRLGAREGVKEILQHKWFRKISLNDVLNKRVTPPMQPNHLHLNFDLKNLSTIDQEVRDKLMGKAGFKKDFKLFQDLYFDYRDNPHAANQQLLFREHKKYVDKIQIQKPRSLEKLERIQPSDKKIDQDKMTRLKKRLDQQSSLRSSPKLLINQYMISEKLKTETSGGSSSKRNY